MSGHSARQRAASLRNLAHARAHHRGHHPSAGKTGTSGQPHALPKVHLAAVRQAASPIQIRIKHLARVKLHL